MAKTNPAPAATNTGAAASAQGDGTSAAAATGTTGTDQGLANALANSGEAAQRAAMEGSSDLMPTLQAAIAGTERALRVVARPPTFRRAGREFGPVAEVIPLRLLTSAEIDAIENEPELVSTRVFVPVDPADAESDD